MLPFVDVHCHLDHPWFDTDRDDVIRRAEDAGVSVIITHGINPATNRKTLDLAEKYPCVKSALGIYPVDAFKREADSVWPYHEFDVDEEIKFIRANAKRVVGIGEIGLDGVEKSQVHEQIIVFERMIALAEDLNLPIIVHSRKAEREVLDVLEKHPRLKVLLHCFCGGKILIARAEKMGCHFSIPANVVRSQEFQSLAKMVSISRLLTETDAPFLSPVRGERCEPASVVGSVQKIAEIKGMTIEETAKNIFLNYQRLF